MEPADPIERIDSVEPMDRIELRDPIDHSEGMPRLCAQPERGAKVSGRSR